MQRAVVQQHGMCRLAKDTGMPMGCPIVEGYYCGLESACGSEWSLDCQGAQNEPSYDCTYSTGTCTEIDADTVSFDVVQTLNGKAGLIVTEDGVTCEFRPCNPL